MIRLLILLMLCASFLSACRYWVLYEFAEQFCEFDEYVQVKERVVQNKYQVSIDFVEPILDRDILFRYLQADPFASSVEKALKSKEKLHAEDLFALGLKDKHLDEHNQGFQFNLNYFFLDKHALLQGALLDEKLSLLFSPQLVEILLRSLCSEDYSLSRQALDMRFQLPSLMKHQLPDKTAVIKIFGLPDQNDTKALDVNSGVEDQEAELHYELAFYSKSPSGDWSVQNKPVLMLFTFDSQNRLSYLYIHYYKYDYWLDVTNRSGRLLITRK